MGVWVQCMQSGGRLHQSWCFYVPRPLVHSCGMWAASYIVFVNLWVECNRTLGAGVDLVRCAALHHHSCTAGISTRLVTQCRPTCYLYNICRSRIYIRTNICDFWEIDVYLFGGRTSSLDLQHGGHKHKSRKRNCNILSYFVCLWLWTFLVCTVAGAGSGRPTS